MTTSNASATPDINENLADETILSDVHIPAVTVSTILLRHEIEFMAELHLPKNGLLENVLLEIKGGALQLTATDGCATVIMRIPVAGSDSFVATLKADKFYAACKCFPAGDAQLSFADGRVILELDALRCSLKDRPEAAQAIRSGSTVGASGQTALVSAGCLVEVLEQSAPFAPKKRQYTKIEMGVFLSIGNPIRAFTLDHCRAIKVSARANTPLNLGHLFVARQYLQLLMNVTPVGDDDALFLGVHGNDLRVECAPRVIVIRDALRAKIRAAQLFTKLPEPAATVTLDADSLLIPFQQLALVWEGRVRSVELTVEPGKLILGASNESTFDGEIEIEAETVGLGTCAINAGDLLQFIKVRSGEKLQMHIPTQGNPVLVSSGETQLVTTTIAPEPKAEPEPAA
jgi:DNA polymerase III sliding clamp (beta) subunit (PCNA family)